MKVKLVVKLLKMEQVASNEASEVIEGSVLILKCIEDSKAIVTIKLV